MSTPAAGPWTKYANDQGPWSKYAKPQVDISNEASMAANPPAPTVKPIQMQAQSPTLAKLTHIAASQRAPGAEEIGKSSVEAAKFGTEALGGEAFAGPLARLAESHVLPALKAVPWVGRVVSAVDEAPGVFGKALRGATVGGAAGGVEGAVRGRGLEGSAEDAAKGAAFGGAMGLALPAIHHFSGVKPPEVFRGSAGTFPAEETPVAHGALPHVNEFYENRGAELNKMRSMNEALERRQAREAKANVPEPEPPPLGSPENPGWHSKIPSRMPATTKPNAIAAETPTGEGPALPRGQVVKLPVPRETLPGENPEFMKSIPRARLTDLGRQGRPGAGEQLRNIGKNVIYVPEEYPHNPVERLRHVGLENRITLNPIGGGGARPLTENQFESSFGPEHREVGDLAEWETGSREGVRPKKVLVP